MDKKFFHNELFQQLSNAQTVNLMNLSQIIHVSKDEILIEEGDFSYGHFREGKLDWAYRPLSSHPPHNCCCSLLAAYN